MSRAARIELVEAQVDWYEEEDEQGRVWTDKPPLSHRPHYLRLVAGNGQIVATSELYANKANAKRAAGTWVTAFYDVWSSGRPVVEVTE